MCNGIKTIHFTNINNIKWKVTLGDKFKKSISIVIDLII